VVETTVKMLPCCGFRRDGTSVSVIVEEMCRNKCFFKVRISHFLSFISIFDLFADSPSYRFRSY
jgi:hypothetical protein